MPDNIVLEKILSIKYLNEKMRIIRHNCNCFAGLYNLDGTHVTEETGFESMAEADTIIHKGILTGIECCAAERRCAYRVFSSEGLRFAVAPVYYGVRPMAFCIFGGITGDSEDDFKKVCGLVAVEMENIRAIAMVTCQSTQQLDKLEGKRAVLKKETHGQSVLSEFLARINQTSPSPENITQIFSMIGELMDLSRLYYYKREETGGWTVNFQWVSDRCGDVKKTWQIPMLDQNGIAEGILELCTDGEQDNILETLQRESFIYVAESVLLWKRIVDTTFNINKEIHNFIESLNTPVYVADVFNHKILYANKELIETFTDENGNEEAEFWDLWGLPELEDETSNISGTGELMKRNSPPILGEVIICGKKFQTMEIMINWIDGQLAIVTVLNDISEFDKMERKIKNHIYYNPFLDIYNQKKFDIDLNNALANAFSASGALLSIDIDDLRYIIDAFGYDVGNEVTLRFVNSLKKLLGDNIYRLNDDKFMAILTNIEALELRDLVAGIILQLQKDIIVDGKQAGCTASIGVARFPEDGHIARHIIRSAEMAKERAKDNGKGNAVFFRSPLDEILVNRNDWREPLKREVEDGFSNMRPLYRPVFDTRTEQLSLVKADLLWESPDSAVLANDFLPQADAIGFTTHITNWFFDSAVRDFKKMLMKKPDLKLIFKAITRPLQSDDFAGFVMKILEKHHCPAQNLVLQVSENLIFYDSSRKFSQLKELRKNGVRVCVSRFGTGESSPLHIKQDLWDSVKISSDYVDVMLDDTFIRTFIKTRIQIACAAGMRSYAEGVANDDQRNYLLTFGCDFVEGKKYSESLTAESFLKMLE